MQLSQTAISKIDSDTTNAIRGDLFELPEKILQFGTGVLLRGLCDYLVDKANKQHIFNGRIVVVKSTSNGSVDAFVQQDCLYTHLIKGISRGEVIDEKLINASISRVINAADKWSEVLSTAEDENISIIISNTTEVGIAYVAEDIDAGVPESYPAKLLAWLYKRYEIFEGDEDAGVVIIPTELVADNATQLKKIVLQLAEDNELPGDFVEWLHSSNHFCNSLVDRIVPGKPKRELLANALEYEDDLVLMSEPYLLWAVEGDDRIKEVLSFSSADGRMIIEPDISKYRELKLRLLNGAHTFCCGLAVLSKLHTVKEAMQHAGFNAYIRALMLEEIVPALAWEGIDEREAKIFAEQVLDRFSNPFIEHAWINITLQYSGKMNSRNIPNIIRNYKAKNEVPQKMAIGFAAYILFMHSNQLPTGEFAGVDEEINYIIKDDRADLLYSYWQITDLQEMVTAILADTQLWGTDLNELPGFAKAITNNILKIQERGTDSVYISTN